MTGTSGEDRQLRGQEARVARISSDPDCDDWIQVHEVGHEVVTEEITIPSSDGVRGGIAVTGFFDVEKIICIRGKTFFLEKKLPFQILLLHLHS